jgi:transcriptional/translational regulatory protein YebC/TACO1
MTLSLQEIYLSLRPPASPDPALNPRLSAILAKAREVGYPKSNVDTAMNKVSPQSRSGEVEVLKVRVPEVRLNLKLKSRMDP